jgi:hypothetical protein
LEPTELFQGGGIRAIREFEARNQKKKEQNLLELKKFEVLMEEIVEKKNDKKWKNEELVIK